MHAKVGWILPSIPKGCAVISDNVNVRSAVHAEAPWSGSGRSGGATTNAESLRYKGWVLVDDRGWRWASNGIKRLKVCRDHGIEHRKAIDEFQRRVDEYEEG